MKAQSATEYLMTYGWAILIVIIVVAALYSLGVFNYQNYTTGTWTYLDGSHPGDRFTSLPAASNCSNICIPDGVFVTAFCKDRGYDSGWLDSQGCGMNQIKCHRQVGEAQYFDCVDVRAI